MRHILLRTVIGLKESITLAQKANFFKPVMLKMAAPITTHGEGQPKGGTGVFVTSEDHPNCILLGIRKGSTGAGTYALPGGRLECGETWEECGKRETKEETGLILKDVRIVYVFELDGKKEVCLQGEVDVTYQREPETVEPGKCEGWKWYNWNNIPPYQELFRPLRIVLEDNFNPFRNNEI